MSRPTGAPRSAAGSTSGGPDSGSRQPGGSSSSMARRLNVRDARRPAPARRCRRGHAARHQPGMDVLHVLQVARHPSDPDAGSTCCPTKCSRPAGSTRSQAATSRPSTHGEGQPASRNRGPPPQRPPGIAGAARWLVAVALTSRPRQWPKNLLVFAAPLAGASLGQRRTASVTPWSPSPHSSPPPARCTSSTTCSTRSGIEVIRTSGIARWPLARYPSHTRSL